VHHFHFITVLNAGSGHEQVTTAMVVNCSSERVRIRR
jgi:hypothetical protein